MINQLTATVLRRLGYRITPLEKCFDAMSRAGYRPGHIVDVGANRGGWTRLALRHFPDAHYTLLEPQAWLKPSVEDLLNSNPRVHWHNAGAGEVTGTLHLTVAERDDSSSFRFTSEEAKAMGRRQIEVPVVTLNQLLADPSLPAPDVIKIDAEGMDLAVVRGACDFVGKTEVFFIEAGVMNKRIQNDVLTVLQTMRDNCYRLFDITDLNRTRRHGALWLVELAFIRVGGTLDQLIVNYE